MQIKNWIFLSALLLCFSAIGQSDTTIFKSPDKEAEFPGGYGAMTKWFQEHIDFPLSDGEMPESKILISFIVEKDGSLSDVKSLRTGKLSEAAARSTSGMPCWIPARQNGMPCRSLMQIPINICYME